MPIVYETEAPVAQSGEVARQAAVLDTQQRQVDAINQQRQRDYTANQQRQQDARQLLASQQRGGGYGDSRPYDTGIQDAIQFRDTMQFQQQKAAQDNQRAYDLQTLEGSQRIQQQNNQANLQAQLQDVELSQQERMRLQRLKNAVGEINNDPTLTAEQKSDYLQQVKYNVDPLQRRLAQEKLASMQMEKEAYAEKLQAEAAFRQNDLKIASANAEDRVRFIPDPDALMQSVAAFKSSVGDTLAQVIGPQAAQEAVEKLARQEVMRQGLGKRYIIQPGGKMELEKPTTGPGAKGDDGSGVAGGKAPTYQDAVKQVETEAGFHTTGEDNVKKSSRPELHTKEGFDARLQEILNQHAANTPPKKVYKHPLDKPVAAASTPTPPPSAPTVMANIDIRSQELANSVGISDDERNDWAQKFARAREIAAKYPDPNYIPANVKAEVRSMSEQYEQVRKRLKPLERKPVAAAANDPRPAAAPGTFKPGQQVPGMPNGVVYDVNGRAVAPYVPVNSGAPSGYDKTKAAIVNAKNQFVPWWNRTFENR